MSHESIAQRWADFNIAGRGRKDHGGGTKSRVTFSGRFLKSYYTTIAAVHADNGGKFALVTNKGYSVSSRRHVEYAASAVRMAAHLVNNPHLTLNVEVYHVPFIGAPGGWNSHDSFDMAQVHASNAASLKEAAQEAADEGLKLWKEDAEGRYWTMERRREYWRNSVETACRQLALYVQRFGVSIEVPEAGTLIRNIEEVNAKRWQTFMDPKAVRRRENARLRKMARKVFLRKPVTVEE